MDMEANQEEVAMNGAAEAHDKNPSACSLFRAKIIFLAYKIFNKINQPPTVPISPPHNTPPSPEETMNPMIRRRGLGHPIFKMIKEQELGKSVLSVGVAAVIAALVSGSGIAPKTLTGFMCIVLSGLCLGCVGIWNGILLRETFPLAANVIELLGIALALIFLNGLIGSFLAREFVWLPIVCGVWCLTPFIIMIMPA